MFWMLTFSFVLFYRIKTVVCLYKIEDWGYIRLSWWDITSVESGRSWLRSGRLMIEGEDLNTCSPIWRLFSWERENPRWRSACVGRVPESSWKWSIVTSSLIVHVRIRSIMYSPGSQWEKTQLTDWRLEGKYRNPWKHTHMHTHAHTLTCTHSHTHWVGQTITAEADLVLFPWFSPLVSVDDGLTA